jgi:hypothetical protein
MNLPEHSTFIAGDKMATVGFLKDIMLCGGALLMAHLSEK